MASILIAPPTSGAARRQTSPILAPRWVRQRKTPGWSGRPGTARNTDAPRKDEWRLRLCELEVEVAQLGLEVERLRTGSREGPALPDAVENAFLTLVDGPPETAEVAEPAAPESHDPANAKDEILTLVEAPVEAQSEPAHAMQRPRFSTRRLTVELEKIASKGWARTLMAWFV